MARSRFEEVASELEKETKTAANTKIELERELNKNITEYFTHLKTLLEQSTISGQELRLWIDSSASVLGRTLSEEKVEGLEIENVKDAIDRLLEEEAAYDEGQEIIRTNARAAGLEIDAYLETNKGSASLSKIVRIKDQAEAAANVLRDILKRYALHLIDILQRNNEEKGRKIDTDFAAWKAAFSPLESLQNKTHETQVATIIQNFIESKIIETKRRIGKDFPEFLEAKLAVDRVVWVNYTRAVNEALNSSLPGDENEQRRRTLLREFLNTSGEKAIMLDRKAQEPLTVSDNVRKELPPDTVRLLAEEYIRAKCLADRRPKGGSIDQDLYFLAVAKTRDMLQGSILNSMGRLRKPEDGNGDLSKTISRVTADREIRFLNSLDAVTEFLLITNTEDQQRQLTSNTKDFRLLSPCWKKQHERTLAETMVPSFGMPVTEDGVFYNPAEGEDSLTDTEARRIKNAFRQQLSTALNASRLQEDVAPITPEDHRDKGNRRILTAEQRALAAEAAQGEAEQKIKTLEAQLAAQAGELAKEKDGRARAEATEASRELTLRSAQGELQTKKDDLAAITALSEQRNDKLNEAKKTLKAAEKDRAELARITAALEIAIQKAGFFGGISKRAIEEILNPSTKEQK